MINLLYNGGLFIKSKIKNTNNKNNNNDINFNVLDLILVMNNNLLFCYIN